jgi:hypothetical protein
MAEITPSAVSDISPNQGATALILSVTPTHASTNTVVVPANRMSTVKMVIVENLTTGVIMTATWTGRTITLSGIGSGSGASGAHTILVIGI